MQTTLYVTIKVVVETAEEMEIDKLIDKFEQECDYNIIGTDDIVVKETQYLETSTKYN